MTRIAKLLTQAQQRHSLSFSDFERLIRAFGFELDRQNGSHRIWQRVGIPQKITIQPRRKDAKPYQVRQFFAIVTEFDLTIDEDAS